MRKHLLILLSLIIFTRFCLGQTASEVKQADMLIKICNNAIEKKPNDTFHIKVKGDAFMLKHEYHTAINNYSKAIKLSEKYFESFLNRGLAYYYIKEYKNSLNDFNTALSIKENEDVFFYIASTYEELETLDSSIVYLNKAMLINPNNPIYYNNRGLIYLSKKMFDLAEQDFKSCVQYDSTETRYFNNLGNCLFF